ncbi:Sugar kinase of the NBD/HSP70 family, may contain an N-terminal HTH domain [Agromyces sp. CF514]|uniref:ROK family transcriptional regulator n=1 Tax=Agromyces sp. CF514 TaxID=1881031 RepID=UPI0008F2BA54|nr:ROK family transcriptional regulator [Agromyces sp. CF514]SFR68469.1 Sugar kinase of the NBD/HSP70 family, may contain an N-terminal HTH domain [Agromyces sp. CF514]
MSSLASADVRRHNLALVATKLAELGEASRSDLADATGLTRGSLTALVRELERGGLVHETESVAPEGRGRPRTLLALSADHLALVTVLIDADHASAVASTLGGTRLARVELRHGRPMGDPGRVLDTAAEALDAVLDRLDGRAVAEASVVVWAPIGGEPALVLADTDLGWGTVDVLTLLGERSARFAALRDAGAARLVADTAVAALAEHAAAGGPAELVYLKSDSGIGGAVITGGTPLDGTHRLAAALGHLPIVPGGVRCECGQHGCLVTVAGPDVLLEAAGLGDLARDEGLEAALDEFVRRIHAEEPAAAAAWRAGSIELARAIQIVVLTVDPALVVLGGYLARLADDVAERLAEIQPGIAGIAVLPPPVVGSRLGRDAALIGAEQAAVARLLADPVALARG